jgi:hypothetical protein
MPDFLDQIFITSKQWLLGFAPEMLRPLASAVLSVAAL